MGEIKMITLNTREDWLANRHKGIGGSDIASVLGRNPYMSNIELWEAKTGRTERPDISDKPFVKYGHDAEEHLRALFALDFPDYTVNYEENNSWTNSDYPWAVASLDGWLTDATGRRGVLEIKTTELLNSMHKEKWDHRIPDNYYCQVLLYMAVIEADFACLKAQLKSNIHGEIYLQTKHYWIERSEVQEDIDYILARGAAFWEYVKNDTMPPLILPEI